MWEYDACFKTLLSKLSYDIHPSQNAWLFVGGLSPLLEGPYLIKHSQIQTKGWKFLFSLRLLVVLILELAHFWGLKLLVIDKWFMVHRL